MVLGVYILPGQAPDKEKKLSRSKAKLTKLFGKPPTPVNIVNAWKCFRKVFDFEQVETDGHQELAAIIDAVIGSFETGEPCDYDTVYRVNTLLEKHTVGTDGNYTEDTFLLRDVDEEAPDPNYRLIKNCMMQAAYRPEDIDSAIMVARIRCE